MDKEYIDMLYHLLRQASNEPPDARASFPLQHLILGLARHLLGGGDYLALNQYLAYYGEKHLLVPTAEEIADRDWEFNRVVDLGCGLGWLGRGLSLKLDVPCLGVDKRSWTTPNMVVLDLETEKGLSTLKSMLGSKDILVMSDFLHCIDDPVGFLSELKAWPVVVLEYTNEHPDYMVSYADQIRRYGAEAIAPLDFELEFIGRETVAVDLFPYMLVLADKAEE